MSRSISEAGLQEILTAVAGYPDGAMIGDIEGAMPTEVPKRTLQYRLRALVEANRLRVSGENRATRYHAMEPLGDRDAQAEAIPLSKEGRAALAYIDQPVAARRPVGYDRAFLESYRPNETFYLSEAQRSRLAKIGKPIDEAAPAGTYAKQILDRLLIDLAWNSSRLEGNTYSLLDTRRLINFGEAAQGHAQREAQMILNHKDAIEFLVASAGETGFDRHTILNLHAMLANNLLADARGEGRLRQIAVGIAGSTFLPLDVPAAIEQCFDQLLASAAAINDPLEQSLFVMVQLPYLQPFDDVNKRVSRLAANISLIRANLAPLAFTDVPDDLYIRAMLAVYETRDVSLIRDLFLWAYERSAQRYAAVRQNLGDPDPFRLRYREPLRAIVRDIVRAPMDRKRARAHLVAAADDLIAAEDRAHFIEAAETELLSLHEGNFARYQVRPSEFAAWQAAWGAA